MITGWPPPNGGSSFKVMNSKQRTIVAKERTDKILICKRYLIMKNKKLNNKLKTKTLLLFLFILLIPAGVYWALHSGDNGRPGQLPYQDLRRQLTINLPRSRPALPSPVEKIPAEERTAADLILLGARQEAVNKNSYDAAYAAISYPGHPDCAGIKTPRHNR